MQRINFRVPEGKGEMDQLVFFVIFRAVPTIAATETRVAVDFSNFWKAVKRSHRDAQACCHARNAANLFTAGAAYGEMADMAAGCKSHRLGEAGKHNLLLWFAWRIRK